MYSNVERNHLLGQISTFTKNSPEFSCLLQIGSGAEGFTDIYSDIDLMAGCVDDHAVEQAEIKLKQFFLKHRAIYLDHRKWAAEILGISAYFENGLSVDISFMPTPQIPLATKHWRLLWASCPEIESILAEKNAHIPEKQSFVDKKFHHAFFYSLRKAEIAILRNNYIYAEISISEARQKLLLAEAMLEGKKLHQFKAFHTLDILFLEKLLQTYPKLINAAELTRAKENLLELYIQTISTSSFCEIDPTQFQIIHCFE